MPAILRECGDTKGGDGRRRFSRFWEWRILQDLNQYIVESLPSIDAISAELSEAIKRTRKLFAAIPFRERADAWGYRVLDDNAERDRNEPPAPGRLSQSTVSMIVAALLPREDTTEFFASSGVAWRAATTDKEVDGILAKRATAALKLLDKAWELGRRTSPYLKSTTYGYNDILSLSWHYDVFRSPAARGIASAADIVKDCEKLLLDRAADYVKADTSYLAICSAFRDGSTPIASDGRVGDSSYILLRFVRCLKCLALARRGVEPKIRSALARASKRLQSKLHDQLSLAEITDSRFDPAELAFCLEGLLLLKPEQVEHRLFDRVIAVLSKAQEQSAYWRSETPIVIQQRGHVLFPIGVEVARSLLNSITLFAKSVSAPRMRQEIRPEHLTVLKRYWAWLKSRQTAIKRKNELLHGWHSEHINDPDLVHTWETSQILEFLIGFKSILAAHIADQLLAASRLDVRYPKPPIDWSDVVKDYEPYDQDPHDIYRQIGVDFVDDRKSGQAPRYWSMLLYGPPGTGKSTVAENLGDCLNGPVITVTVSDFLGEGESRMESRVKNIFTVIERQSGAIVLFDEMDQFLLDRDSKLFREQDSVFQFLTPGMLTKFAKLRKSESVIFIVATNYEERIDPAIKRAGRIDRHYLVLPPDNARRMKIMLGDKNCGRLVERATDNEKRTVLEASCLLAYTDIKRAAAHAERLAEFKTSLRRANRNIQFSSMKGRFADSRSRGLEKEVEAIIGLIDEAQVKTMKSVCDWDGNGDFRNFIESLPHDSPTRKLHDKLDEAKEARIRKARRKSRSGSRTAKSRKR
jgi:hypothetical protein